MKRAILLVCAVLALATGAATASPQTPTVHIVNFAFKPASLTVHAGDRVTFVNDDSDAHTVTALDRSFSSPGLDTGDRWSYTFAKAGTFAYVCGLHPYMKGTIVVLGGTQ
jgi:plastocyanin